MTVRSRLVRASAAAGILALGVTACGGDAATDSAAAPAAVSSSATTPSAPGPTASAPGATASAPAQAADTTTATTLDGAQFDFASLDGKATVLWFWAPWCTICRVEAPEIGKVAAELGDDVRVLGVPGRGEQPAMRQFVEDTGVGDLEHVVDADGQIWSTYGVISQPAFAFISPSGEVEVVNGALSGEELEATARSLLS